MKKLEQLKKSHFMYTVGFLDPAGGKEKKEKGKARSAIVVVSVDAANRYFVRYSWAERCSTEKIMNQIWRVNAMFNVNLFGIESNAQQGLFVDAVQMEVARLQKNYPIQAVCQPTTIEKTFRVRSIMQLPVTEGRLFLCRSAYGYEELVNEILNFPMSSTVDMIDALASAIELCPKYEPMHVRQHDDEAYLQYLRDSGAPMSYIQKEADRIRRANTSPKTLAEYVSMLKSKN